MATEQKIDNFLRYLLLSMICTGIFLGFATFWSARPAIRAGFGMLTLDVNDLHEQHAGGELSSFSLRQQIQMHFLGKNVYLPLEDIIYVESGANLDSRPIFLMRNACGEGKLFIWIPFIIRLPLYGNSVWEFCWTPL